MHTIYEKCVTAVKTLNSKGESLWGNLVMFASEHGSAEELKKSFKRNETEAEASQKVRMTENSTYKVAKSVIQRAVESGIPLLDSKGKPRGKTAIELDLADLKTVKTELEKFKTTMATAGNIAAKLTTESDKLTAAKLVDDLLKSLSVGLKLVA